MQRSESPRTRLDVTDCPASPNIKIPSSKLKPSRNKIAKDAPLGPGFQTGSHDVVCGRGKSAYASEGNRRFRLAIWLNMGMYYYSKNKLDKSLVVASIVDAIRAGGGGFVKPNKKQGEGWIEIGDQAAREKTGHALRDAIAARLAEDKKPEKYFTVSIEKLMNMAPCELELLEEDIKDGRFTGRAPVSKRSSSASPIRRCRKKSTKIPIAASLPQPPAVLPSGGSRDSSDPFTPIKLEDAHEMDTSLLHMFAEAISSDEEESSDEELAAFVMEALSDDAQERRRQGGLDDFMSAALVKMKFMPVPCKNDDDDDDKDDANCTNYAEI